MLACAAGGNNTAVAARLGMDRKTVARWRTRFLRDRLDGLSDEPRPGVPRTITDAQVEEVVVRTLEEVPEGATHWSKRELAKRVGISPTSVLHFTPTYSSWINQVERWFAELERRCLERGVFCSLDELRAALEDWIKTWNEQARPFKWTKTTDQIIDRICRYCDRISGPGH